MHMWHFRTLNGFRDYVKAWGGGGNVHVEVRGNEAVGGRLALDVVKEGDEIIIYTDVDKQQQRGLEHERVSVTVRMSARVLKALSEAGIKPNTWGPLAEDPDQLTLMARAIYEQKTRLRPSDKLVKSIIQADDLLHTATRLDLLAGERHWNAHREFLGGVSSITGATLPTWEECGVVPQAAHVHMARVAIRDSGVLHSIVETLLPLLERGLAQVDPHGRPPGLQRGAQRQQHASDDGLERADHDGAGHLVLERRQLLGGVEQLALYAFGRLSKHSSRLGQDRSGGPAIGWW